MILSLKKFQFSNIAILAIFAFLSFSLVSCEKDAAQLIDTENFTDSSIRSLQRGAIGKSHCLELIFPVSIEFIDGSIAEVEDYESMKETISDFFETNDIETIKENKPALVFPLEVLNEEGEVISVANQEELKELKSECPSKGGKNNGFRCFELVFPVSLTIGDDTVSFESKEELKEAIKAYKESAEEGAERPSFLYPITIEYEDGTTQDVESQEELKAIKEECKNS